MGSCLSSACRDMHKCPRVTVAPPACAHTFVWSRLVYLLRDPQIPGCCSGQRDLSWEVKQNPVSGQRQVWGGRCGWCCIHPDMFCQPSIRPNQGHGGLLEDTGQQAGTDPGHIPSPIDRPLTPGGSLGFPVNRPFMFLDCGRTLVDLERPLKHKLWNARLLVGAILPLP